jgi:hypothetical protein
MNAQEAILKIKALFEDNAAPVQELEAAPTETKVELAEYSLADGSKVEISALEVGGTVKLADGTSPAMGEYQLMDGTSIQLDENGIIVEIAAPAEDTMPEEVAPADMNKAQDQKMAEQFADFEIKIAELEEAKKKSEEKVNEIVDTILGIIPDNEQIRQAVLAKLTERILDVQTGEYLQQADKN